MAATSVVVTNYRTLCGEIRDGAYRFPTITTTTRTGRESTWSIYVRVFDSRRRAADEFLPFMPTYLDNKPLASHLRAWIKVDTGMTGGKMRDSAATIVSTGKNIGRANATNVVCQAIRDALSQYNAQLRKAAPVGADGFYPPMLADKYVRGAEPGSSTRTPAFPVLCQRKYDGIRTVAQLRDGECKLYSRTKVVYPGLAYLKNELLPLLTRARDARGGHALYLDGELYKHGVPLQTITGNGRRVDTVITDYNYMVYDCFVPDESTLTAAERQDILRGLFAHADAGVPSGYAQYVETFTAADTDELEALYDQFITEGYEGLMVRPPACTYVYSHKGYHSTSLLKVKPNFDAEYFVCGWETGTKGKASGLLMIVCRTDDGHEFAVTPALDVVTRKEMADKMPLVEENGKTYFENVWLDVAITVTYDDLSIDGIPLRARTKLHTRVDAPVDATADTDADTTPAAAAR